MLTLLSRLQAGTLGELLTVAKLNSLGHAAYISPEGAPGHDVIIVIDGVAKSIEVKTRQFRTSPAQDITRWPVNMTTKGDADFFIFIELDLRTLTPTFYLLTNAQARTTFRDYIGGGNCYPPDVRRLITPNDFSALTAHHHDALCLLATSELSDRPHVIPLDGEDHE
ncbi:hypothetical protein [Rhizobium aegyptiacum]|uniref:hypothetical protein n=1 Tax=Rhizobium aegyptiacum TaxID=1764550 RepID=UPI0007E58409|nr:hypothetical protein [Rhizobium aegyptiacum]